MPEPRARILDAATRRIAIVGVAGGALRRAPRRPPPPATCSRLGPAPAGAPAVPRFFERLGTRSRTTTAGLGATASAGSARVGPAAGTTTTDRGTAACAARPRVGPPTVAPGTAARRTPATAEIGPRVLSAGPRARPTARARGTRRPPTAAAGTKRASRARSGASARGCAPRAGTIPSPGAAQVGPTAGTIAARAANAGATLRATTTARVAPGPATSRRATSAGAATSRAGPSGSGRGPTRSGRPVAAIVAARFARRIFHDVPVVEGVVTLSASAQGKSRMGDNAMTPAIAGGRHLRKNRRRPTLPGGLPPSTIGAGGLNCRVRNGNGCVPAAMATGSSVSLGWSPSTP